MAWGRWLCLLLLLACSTYSIARSIPSDDAATDARARVVAVDPDLELQRVILVRVQGLDRWVKAHAGDPWKLVPYIDGRALVGLYPIAVDVQSGTLQFFLLDQPQNRAVWAHLLSPLAFERPVPFSVGLEYQDALPSDFSRADGRVRLIVVQRTWSLLAATAVLLLGFLLARLAVRTPLLMDAIAQETDQVRWRFSLAKLQFALWFFVIVGSFLVIWLTTGEFNSLNASVISVLGISAATAVGDSLLQRHVTGGASPGDRPAPSELSWRGFWSDVISDERGHSLARFQMLAWTAILIVVFLVDVVDDLRMPVLGVELLYLLGLSSGAFVAQRPTGPGTNPSSAPAPGHAMTDAISPADRQAP